MNAARVDRGARDAPHQIGLCRVHPAYALVERGERRLGDRAQRNVDDDAVRAFCHVPLSEGGPMTAHRVGWS